MKKAAGRKSTTSAQRDMEQLVNGLGAKQQFIGATLNLSWRLALTVLIPLISGIQLDKKFDTSPVYAAIGFVLAILFGSMAVWATVKELNELQAEEDADNQKLKEKKRSAE